MISHRLDKLQNKITKSKRIPSANKKKLMEFITELQANQRTDQTVINYLECLIPIAHTNFKSITKADMGKILSDAEKKYSPSTVNLYKAIYKKFFKWLYGNREYPKVVSWIVQKAVKNNKTSDDLLAQADIDKLLSASGMRERCLIKLLAESGCRISELMSLKLKNVLVDDVGVVITLNGKTGIRRLRLVNCGKEVSDWLEYHPYKNNREAYLFCRTTDPEQFLTPLHVRNTLKIIAKKTGVSKPVNPHNFRHSQLTNLHKAGFSETELKVFAGWTQNSQMPATYLHLDDKDIEEKYLKIFGKQMNKKKVIEKKMTNADIIKAVVDVLEKKGIL